MYSPGDDHSTSEEDELRQLDTNLRNTCLPDTDIPHVLPRRTKGFPVKQLILLACCRLSEPISMTSSFPYLFFMIRDFQLSSDEKQIGRYAGILASSFTFAQFLSGTPSHTLSAFLV
jgi:hypothetical protein